MGVLYKNDSRTLILASMGEGFLPLNLPPRRRSADLDDWSVSLLRKLKKIAVVKN
jgi:hypothetical protein